MKILLSEASYFHMALDQLTDVIVHDIFSPPVASRVYVYPCIAAYECVRHGNSELKSFAGQLHGLTVIPQPVDTARVLPAIAAMTAFYKVGQTLIFSEDKLSANRDKYLKQLDSLNIPEEYLKSSMQYGETVAKHILKWSDKDNYKESRSFPKFSISDDPSEWKPTPPAYMEGIEPHWREIRTMVLDSAQQFKPAAPPAFDRSEGSEFYKYLMEVYEVVKQASEEEKKIASFWDCNPYVMNQTGHMMFATKKITPGGHWMGITNIASEVAGHRLEESIELAAMVSIGLFDAFISCWDEKYRSNLIRPETVINEYIDESWLPLLQTPPFPEHTSGHSVISTAAATILTTYLGNEFAYTDDVEVKYGLEQRSFKSFYEASAEAAISRLYGGIHYRPAIDDGVEQGKKVGEFIVNNLSLAK